MQNMLNDQAYFEALADPIRRRILVLLLKQGELCVCELYQALDLPQPKVSRHLGVLRTAEILIMRREGTWVFYRLHAQLPLWAYRVLEALAQSMEQSPLIQGDCKRLEEMPDRPVRCCA